MAGPLARPVRRWRGGHWFVPIPIEDRDTAWNPNAFTATIWTTYDVSNVVPSGAVAASILFLIQMAGDGVRDQVVLQARRLGSTVDTDDSRLRVGTVFHTNLASGLFSRNTVEATVELDKDRKFQVKFDATGGTAWGNVRGYYI